jgi:acetyl-CoA carboxylase biotin carboxyl carrier protein
MIDLDYLEQLIRLVDESGLDSLEVEDEGTMIRLAKSPDGGVVAGPAPQLVAGSVAQAADPAVAAPEAIEPESHLVDVTSPMVGTFYRSPAPDAPSYVDVGSSVAPGATLCIIEAMKLMNELEAEVSGRVVEVCVENAQPVEYGQVLFRIDPS